MQRFQNKHTKFRDLREKCSCISSLQIIFSQDEYNNLASDIRSQVSEIMFRHKRLYNRIEV